MKGQPPPMAKRRKKTAKRAKKSAKKRVTVSKTVYDKLVHLGATHHATLKQLRASARVTKAKPAKKARRRRRS